MRRHILVVLVAAASLAADAPKKVGPDAEQAKLQGKWNLVAFKEPGAAGLTTEPVPEAGGPPALTINKDRLIYYGLDAGHYTIDSSKSPKTIDLSIEKGADAGVVERGVYKIEGDTLTICTVKARAPRPKDYTASPGRSLSIYRRIP